MVEPLLAPCHLAVKNECGCLPTITTPSTKTRSQGIWRDYSHFRLCFPNVSLLLDEKTATSERMGVAVPRPIERSTPALVGLSRVTVAPLLSVAPPFSVVS